MRIRVKNKNESQKSTTKKGRDQTSHFHIHYARLHNSTDW